MKILFVLFSLLLFSGSLEAYSKKIVLSTFSKKSGAIRMKAKIYKDYPSLVILSKKYNFDYLIQKNGNYYLLIAAPFHESKILQLSKKPLSKKFKGAFFLSYETPKKTIIKKENKIEKIKDVVVQKSVETTPKIEKKVIEKKVEKKIEKKVIENKIEKKQEQKIEKVIEKKPEPTKISTSQEKSWFSGYYLIVLILGVAGFIYFRKFKKIYDQY